MEVYNDLMTKKFPIPPKLEYFEKIKKGEAK